MNLPVNIHQLFFLGIGGIGMSALARWFKSMGYQVSGYDRTPSRITRELESEGIPVLFEDRPEMLRGAVDMVVYTPAIPKQLQLRHHLESLGVPFMKRAEVLGRLSADHFTIAIGGTHGKTSITSLLAWIMHEGQLPFHAFIGGISKNFKSNLVMHPAARYLLVEADEYDRSFLQLHPEICLISAMDADHLDIYGNREGMLEAYRDFARLTGPRGLCIQHYKTDPLGVSARSLTYGLHPNADCHAESVRNDGFGTAFTLCWQESRWENVRLSIPGTHNLENALGACAIALSIGIEPARLFHALNSYEGVVRRFDLRCDTGETVFIDDYAHHPEELNACIRATREIYPDRKITGIFQPHLYSRTRDFADGFARSLDALDEVILMDIYPARELPLPDVDSSMIIRRMQNKAVRLLTRSEILAYLTENEMDVLLTLGAGDIDTLVPEIEIVLKTWSTTRI